MVGAGTMGVGIAHALAVSGAETVVVEPSDDRVGSLRRTLADVLSEGVRRGRLDDRAAADAEARVSVASHVGELPLGLDLVVESVPEVLELKQQIVTEAEAREPLLLATNTSSLSVDTLAAGLKHPERFCGMHFFNPVWSLRLVEVVKGRQTSEETVQAALGWVERIGKVPAVVRDAPGFATSRLDLCLALEAIRMVEEGVADAAHIDRAMKIAYRHPVGPLELSDIVGLDVRLDIARSLEASLGSRYAPPRLLADKVAAGELGQKSGRGFYDWPEHDS